MNEHPSVVQAAPSDFNVLDLALAYAEKIRLLILVPLGTGLVALGLTYVIAPTFTATTRILPPMQQQSASAALTAQLGSLATLMGGAVTLKNPADQYVSLLRSRTVSDAIVQRFSLRELYDVEYLEDARTSLEKRTKIYAGAKDGIISIEVEDHDPKRAADIANAFVEELRKLSKSLAITEAAQRRLFFESQLAQAKDNLTKSEVALRSSGVSEAALKVLPQSALESLARLKAQVTAQEIKLASMRTFMTDSNPEFRLAIQELLALRAELMKLEQTSASTVKGSGAEYISRFRDFKYHETLFDLMAKQYEVARLDEARDGAVIQVIDAAQPADRKIRPKRTFIAVTTTLGVLLLFLIFIYVQWAIRVANAAPESAEKLSQIRRLLRVRRTS